MVFGLDSNMNGWFSIFTCFFIDVVATDISDHFGIMVAEGETVHLKCHRNTDTAVDWKYQRHPAEDDAYLCFGVHLLCVNAPKFELNSIDYTLAINNVTVNDSGVYSCIEDSGNGETHDTQLTVVARISSSMTTRENTASTPTTDTTVKMSALPDRPDHVQIVLLLVVILLVILIVLLVYQICCKKLKTNLHQPSTREMQHLTDYQIGTTVSVTISTADDTGREPSPNSSSSLTGDHTNSPLSLTTSTAGGTPIESWTQKYTQEDSSSHSSPGELYQNYGPLNDSELHHIEFNTPHLIELIDPNEDFLTELVNARCIMRRDKEQIMAIKDRRQKNRKLLDILKGRNCTHLKKFAECLSSNQQKRLVPLLVKTGVIINVDASLDETSVNDVRPTESQIVSTFEQTMVVDIDEQTRAELLSMRKAVKEKAKEFGVDVDLVVLRVQSSIGCYFFCRTSSSLHHMFVLYGNEELRQILESIFNILLRADQRVRIKKLVWIISYYQQCAQYFTHHSRHDGSAGSGVHRREPHPHICMSPKALVYCQEETDEREPYPHICMSPKALVYCQEETDEKKLPSPSHCCMSPKDLVYCRQDIWQIELSSRILSSSKVLLYSRDDVRQRRPPHPHICMSSTVLIYCRKGTYQRKSLSQSCVQSKVLVYCRQEKPQVKLSSHSCVTPKVLVYCRSEIGQRDNEHILMEKEAEYEARTERVENLPTSRPTNRPMFSEIILPSHVSRSPKALIHSRDKRSSPLDSCMQPKALLYRRQEMGQKKPPSHQCMSPKVLVYLRQETGKRDATFMKLQKQEPADIHSLPLELHEMILMGSLYRLTKTLFTIDPRPYPLRTIQVETRAHAIAFKTLSSVCRYFHQMITKRNWFRRQLKKRLTVAGPPYRMDPRLLHRLDTSQRDGVTLMAKLNNRLYVMHCGSNAVSVYTAHQPYRQLHHMLLNGLKSPQNMVADVRLKNDCVYVADPRTGVWRVRTDHKVDKWIDELNAASLSMTSEGHLLILIATDWQGSRPNLTWRGRVEVYSDDKLKLTVLKLPHDVVNPSCVIQTTSRSFIVCHGNQATAKHRVVQVNNKGSIVRAYGGSRGSGLGQLDTPVHITLDNDERVLVADMNNHRVLLLNEKLNIERVLLTWSGLDGVQGPRLIYYDREKSQVLVGLQHGYVDIYSV